MYHFHNPLSNMSYHIKLTILMVIFGMKINNGQFHYNLNTLRPKQNETKLSNVFSWIKNSHKFVPNGPINNIPALVQIMVWCRPGDKPLSEPMMVRLPTHTCITRPQWVNRIVHGYGKSCIDIFEWTHSVHSIDYSVLELARISSETLITVTS